MWVIEELRRDCWARISGPLSADEATTAVRLLRTARPWRAYRVTPA